MRSLIALALLATLLQACGPSREAPARRPNVVVILTDDQRWDAMSCAGHPFLRTPNIDRIAAEGARFANMFVTTSLCSPSRASLLSGLYASTHRIVNNFTDYPADLAGYPRRLQEEGYETGYIGKWHMGEDTDEKRPGFDYWMSHKGQGTYFDTTFNVNGDRKLLKGYYTEVVTDHAVEWIKRPREKPFLLMLGHKAPHSPNTPEPKYAGSFDDVDIRYPASASALQGKPKWVEDRKSTWHGIYGPLFGARERSPDPSPEGEKDFARFLRAYFATIRSVDDSVGRVTEALRESGQLDDTLLVFVSDNGFFLGEHGMMDKRTMHEASIRVPLLVRYPKLVPQGRVVQEMVLNIDLAPSILEVCGAKPLHGIHGASWVRLLRGDARGWRTSWYYEYNYEKQFPYTPNVRGVRTDDWKYIRYPHGDGTGDRHKEELYNLKDDPLEMRNLIFDPRISWKLSELRLELQKVRNAVTRGTDLMPVDEGIKTELPDAKIR